MMKTDELQQNNSPGGVKHLLAHIVSIALIPLLSPIYLFGIILFCFPFLTPITGVGHKLLAMGAICAATTLPPFTLVFVLYKMKRISSLTLDDRKDRLIPQVFSCFNYVLITIILAWMYGLHNALTLSMVAITTSLVAISVITPFWKISTHASGVAGLLAVASALYLKYPSAELLLPYAMLWVLAVLVCLARLQLKVHTPGQVLAGCLLGGSIGFTCFWFLG